MTDAQTIVTTDNIFARNDVVIAKDESISVMDKKCDDINLTNPIYNLLHHAGNDSTDISSNARSEMHSETDWKAKNEARTSVRTLSHVYEEIRAIKEPYSSLHKYDIQNHYEKYSPSTKKASIDTTFFPRHKMCEKCARMQYSPVYTDRLIYRKKSLFAIEVVLRQRDDVSSFAYCDSSREDPSDDPLRLQYDRNLQNCMLIYNYVKTNAAGIFYSHSWPRDIFDLRSLLKPNIYVLNYPCHGVITNTQLYHRYVNNCYVRISKAGCASTIFYRNSSTMITSTKLDDNDDLQNSHESKNNKFRQNRSSLLLLEPLLLTTELASSAHKRNTKNRVFRSERVKIVRILIAYALSFFILTSITFYIVYFT